VDIHPHESSRRDRPRLGDWLRQDTEIRLPRSWLLAGGIVFVLLLLIALD
jgi:hypothetical protein